MATYVPFLTVEGDDDDLLVSFGLGVHAERSLTLLRTPKYESLLPVEERGVSVGTGRSTSLERELLLAVAWGAREVAIRSTRHLYVLDIHAVDPQEIRAAKVILGKMNFDKCFVVTDV